jgi:hypothetical protein
MVIYRVKIKPFHCLVLQNFHTKVWLTCDWVKSTPVWSCRKPNHVLKFLLLSKYILLYLKSIYVKSLIMIIFIWCKGIEYMCQIQAHLTNFFMQSRNFLYLRQFQVALGNPKSIEYNQSEKPCWLSLCGGYSSFHILKWDLLLVDSSWGE